MELLVGIGGFLPFTEAVVPLVVDDDDDLTTTTVLDRWSFLGVSVVGTGFLSGELAALGVRDELVLTGFIVVPAGLDVG